MSIQRTHWDDCWKSGPEHYECAAGEVERLRAGHEREAKALCGSGNYWRNRAEEAEGEVERLRHDIERHMAALTEFDNEVEQLRAERDALRAEVELWKERAYQLSHA